MATVTTLRRIALLGCASAFMLPAVARQDAKVDLHIGGARVPNIVAAMSKAIGKPLTVSTEYSKEIAYVNVQGVTPDELMKQFADSLLGTWVEDAKGTKLIPDSAKWKAQVKKERDARIATLKEQVDKAAKESSGDYTEAMADQAGDLFGQIRSATDNGNGGPGAGGRRFDPQMINKLMQMVPGNRFLSQALTQIDLGKIADLGPGGRLVYSTRPTSMQSPLGGGFMETVRKMVAAERLYRAKMQSQMQPGQRFAFGGGGMFGWDQPIPTGDPSGALLIIKRQGNANAYQVSLVAFNADGQVMADGNTNLSAGGGGGVNFRFGGPMGPGGPGGPGGGQPTPPPASPAAQDQSIAGAKVTYGADSLAMAKALASGPGGFGGGMIATVSISAGGPRPAQGTVIAMPAGEEDTGKSTATADLIAKASAVDVNDPTSYFVADTLDAYAKAKKANIVAVLPDSVIRGMAVATTSKESALDGALNILINTGNMTVTESDGWVTMVPKNIYEQSFDRVDRVALARALKSLKGNPFWSLDGRADYVTTTPVGSSMTEWDFAMIRMVSPNAVADPQFGSDSRDMLAFYGSLSGTQRQIMKSGGVLQISTMVGPQRNALARIVFDSQDGPQSIGTNDPMAQIGPRMGRRGMNISFGPAQPANERTTLLASGLPNGGRIATKVQGELVALARMSNGSQRVMDSGDLANEQMRANGTLPFGGPNNGPNGAQPRGPQIQDYASLQRLNIDFDIVLGEQYGMRRSLSDLVAPSSITYGEYSRLPNDLQSSVAEELKRREEIFQQRGGPNGGGPGRGGGRGPGGGGRGNGGGNTAP